MESEVCRITSGTWQNGLKTASRDSRGRNFVNVQPFDIQNFNAFGILIIVFITSLDKSAAAPGRGGGRLRAGLAVLAGDGILEELICFLVGELLVDDLADGGGHVHRVLTLKNVPAHVHPARAALDGIVGEL